MFSSRSKKPWKALRKRTLVTRLQRLETRAEAHLKSHLSRQRREFEEKEQRLARQIGALKAGHFLRQNVDALLTNLALVTGVVTWSGPHGDGRHHTLSYTGHAGAHTNTPATFVATVNFFTCEVTLQPPKRLAGVESVRLLVGGKGQLKPEAQQAASNFAHACAERLGLARTPA